MSEKTTKITVTENLYLAAENTRLKTENSFLRETLRNVLDGDKGAEKRAREYLEGKKEI